MTVIDVKTKAVSARLAVGEAPQVVAVAPDGSLVLVTCADGVYAIDTLHRPRPQDPRATPPPARSNDHSRRHGRLRHRLRARPRPRGQHLLA